MALGTWMTGLAGREETPPVGVAVAEDALAFANREASWYIHTSAPEPTKKVLGGVLAKVMPLSPYFIARDLRRTTQLLIPWLQLEGTNPTYLPGIFIHDLTSLGEALGAPTQQSFEHLVLDALDLAVVGPQLETQAPRYYRAVGLPLAREESLPYAPLPGKRWQVTYDNLFLRVLAHYTREPVLIRLFRDQPEQPPLDWLADYTGLDTSVDLLSMLLLLTLDDSLLLLRHYFPDWVEALPSNPALMKHEVFDKKLPVVRLWLAEEAERLRQRPVASSLYGRKSPSGPRQPGELLYHIIFGSIDELLAVFRVSMGRYDGPTRLQATEPWRRAVLVGYTGREMEMFEAEATTLAELGNPLAVPLAPKLAFLEEPS